MQSRHKMLLLDYVVIYMYFAQDSLIKVQAYGFIPLLFNEHSPDLSNGEGRWNGG